MKRNRTDSLLSFLVLALIATTGCSSDYSPVAPQPIVPVITEEIDTAPPAIPTGLAATASGVVVKLAWNPNTTDLDLAGFMVYRMAFDLAHPLTAVPITETTFIDLQPLSSAYQYAVSSVDSDGNESGWTLVPYQPYAELPDRHAD